MPGGLTETQIKGLFKVYNEIRTEPNEEWETIIGRTQNLIENTMNRLSPEQAKKIGEPTLRELYADVKALDKWRSNDIGYQPQITRHFNKIFSTLRDIDQTLFPPKLALFTKKTEFEPLRTRVGGRRKKRKTRRTQKKFA